jgi:ATP-dependent RNA helicase DDX27
MRKNIQCLESDIDKIVLEEYAEKQLRKAEMEQQRAANLLNFDEEIHSRPKKVWFQTPWQKKNQKELAKTALGVEIIKKERVPLKK